MGSTRLPILSECILLLMNSMTALAYLIFPSRVNVYLSTFMVGGLFGLMIPPFLILHLSLLYLSNVVHFLSLTVAYTAIFGAYVVTVLVMDKSALRPLPLGKVRKATNAIERLSSKFWSTHFSYFPMNKIQEGPPLDPERQYVFGVHPHGIHCWALNIFAFQGDASPFDSDTGMTSSGRMTGLAATVIFHIPVVRELFLQMGYVDASRKCATKQMEAGRNLFICTGGEEESMRTVMGGDVVVLKKRKGFVRLAVKHGADLVPVFGLGLSDLYTTYSFMIGFRMWLQKSTGIALPIFHGRFLSPLPYKKEIKILVGKPIKIDPKDFPEEGERPDEKIVGKYHDLYMQELQELHKKYGEGRVLEIL